MDTTVATRANRNNFFNIGLVTFLMNVQALLRLKINFDLKYYRIYNGIICQEPNSTNYRALHPSVRAF